MSARPGLWRKSRGNGMAGLVPADPVAESLFLAMQWDEKVLLQRKRARNPSHLAMAWAVFDAIGDSIGAPGEAVLLWLKQRTGRADYVRMPNGEFVLYPHSIDFASMDQGEFAAFWNDCWAILTEEIMPHIPQMVYDHILAITADKRHGEDPAIRNR